MVPGLPRGSRSDRESGRGGRRAQSETLGVVLLLGLVIAGGAVVVVLGSGAIEQSQNRANLDSAEQSMSQFDSQASLVAHGSAESRRAELPVERSGPGGTTVDPNAGTLTIEISGDTNFTRTVTLGTVRYEQGDATIAYQGGGVWRRDDGASTMISPPEFHYRISGDGKPTLTLPLVTVQGAAGDGSVKIDQSGPTESVVPNGTLQNPIRDSEVNVTINSRYYEAWGRFFEERTAGNVTYDHAANEVTIQLVAPSAPATVDGAIISGAGALQLQNSGTVDSYDSRDGDYASTQAANAPVAVEGDFDPQNAVTIKGTVDAGGGATVANSIRVTGTVRIDGSSDLQNSPVFEGPYHTGGDLHVDGSSNLQFRDDVYVGGDVTMLEKGGSDPVIDGGTLYAGGDVTVRQDVDGSVVAGGNVTVEDGATITGDVEAGGDVRLTEKTTVQGDVVAAGHLNQTEDGGQASEVQGDVTTGGDAEGDGDGEDPDGGADEGSIGGTTSENGAADPAPPVAPEDPVVPDLPSSEDEVTEAESEFSASNDNAGTVAEDGQITDAECSPSCTLPPGDYYVNSVSLDGGTLKFDNANGTVELYVAGDSTVQGTSTVELLGDQRVRVYFGDGTGRTLTLQGQTEVVNPGDEAPQFWVYTHPDASVVLQNSVVFRGVVYGADNASGTDIQLQNQAEVYGALAGDIGQTSNNNELHYDEALGTANAFEPSTTTPQVTYLHVSVTPVNVAE